MPSSSGSDAVSWEGRLAELDSNSSTVGSAQGSPGRRYGGNGSRSGHGVGNPFESSLKHGPSVNKSTTAINSSAGDGQDPRDDRDDRDTDAASVDISSPTRSGRSRSGSSYMDPTSESGFVTPTLEAAVSTTLPWYV